MKILIVSGFLGAGKTTFIKELIKRTGKELTVLENEYGDNDLDSRALGKGKSGPEVLEFMEGCVCCTKKDSFVNTILSISAAMDPEYLVVEPTGVGKLGNIIANIEKIQYDRISLLPPVVVLNPRSIPEYLSDYPDIYENQIKYADTIVFSKCESESPEFLAEAEDAVKKLNPDAEIVKDHYSGKDDSWFSSLIDAEPGLDERYLDIDPDDKETDIDQITIKDARLSSPAELIVMLEDIVRGGYGKLPRAKGIITTGSERLRFDVADGMYGITSDDSDGTPVATFIGRDIEASKLLLKLQDVSKLTRPAL